MRRRVMIVLLVLAIGAVIGLGVFSYINMHEHDHKACEPGDGCITLAMAYHDHMLR